MKSALPFVTGVVLFAAGVLFIVFRRTISRWNNRAQAALRSRATQGTPVVYVVLGVVAILLGLLMVVLSIAPNSLGVSPL